MAIDPKKFDGYGLVVSGMVTGQKATKSGKLMLTILAGENTMKVIVDTNEITDKIGDDYHAKVRCFVAGSDVMFMESQRLA